MAILSVDDFKTGITQIASDEYSRDILLTFIDEEWENQQIKLMLGATEGQAFIDDLVSGIPQAAKYTKLFNSFSYEVSNHPHRCIGIKEILKRLLYYNYTNQQANDQTSGGNMAVNQEAASPLNYSLTHRLRNEAVNEVEKLQNYCIRNKETYPSFEFVYQYDYVNII